MLTRRTIVVGFVGGAMTVAAAMRDAFAQSPSTTRVAVLVDTSQGTAGAMNFLRPALATLIAGLPEGTEVLLATTGRRLQVRVQPTADRKKAADSANGMASDGGGTVLMDGLLEIDDRFMKKAANRKPVFIVVTSDGSESSRTEGDAFNAWLRTLAQRGVVAHAIVLKSGNGLPEVVANALTQATGGRCETIGNPGLLKEKTDALGAWLNR
jgi:hypothetical protein